MNEIEDKNLKELKDGVSLLKAKLEHLVHEEKLPWITYVERYLEGGLAKDLWKGLQGSFYEDSVRAHVRPSVSGNSTW